MMNEVVFSEMNQGLIITIFDSVYPDLRSIWFLNEKDAAGYPEDYFQQIRPAELLEIGGEFCYSLGTNDKVIAASYQGVA